MNNFLIKDNDGEFKVLDKNTGTVSVNPKKDETTSSAKPTINQSANTQPSSQSSVQEQEVKPREKITLDLSKNEFVEDQKDIAAHENLSQKEMNHAMNSYIQNLAHGILQDSKLNFPDKNTSDKFVQLIFTILRGARKIAHLKEMMQESKKHFGIDVSREQTMALEKNILNAQKLAHKKYKMMKSMMQNSSAQKQKLQEKGRNDKKQSGIEKLRKNYQAQDYSVDSLVSKKKESVNITQVQKKLDQADTKNDTLTQQPKRKTQRVDAQRVPQQGRQKISLEKQTVKIKPPSNPILVKKKSEATSMVDIVPPEQARVGAGVADIESSRSTTVDTRGPRLSGPIDELRHMTITEFRRLSESLEQRLSKLEEKVHLLEERSYIDRIKGVQAWQASPLYRLYVDMGHEALSKNIPLQTIINTYTEAQKEILTMEEFTQLGLLNHKLSF